MPRIYRLSRTAIRIFYKVRHHKGHGIHSPFVYSMVTKVVEEKLPYYAYKDIEDRIKSHPKLAKKASKSNLLSFRLINQFNPKSILEIGADVGVNALYLTAPSSQIEYIGVELSSLKRGVMSSLVDGWDRRISIVDHLPQDRVRFDCVCVDLTNYSDTESSLVEYLFKVTDKESFIIVKGIRTKKRHRLLWNSLVDSDKVTVSLDLFNEGILFFNPKLYKRTYKISF